MHGFIAPLVLSLAAQAGAADPAAAWPHLKSDIASEPRIHFGVLDNGMRWAWMDNPEPKLRSYMRLHVDAGSLAETEAERGMAHFLEHMCFNGTKAHPGTSLIEWFQEHGMAFGADTNAFTSFSQTVYMLDLPTSDAETLSEGLVVMRNWVDGLALEPAEVEAEKGVIDAEEREGSSPGERILRESFRLQYSGTRIPERDPIGVKAARDAFTAEALRAFQQRWYRPENLTLVLVGDLRGQDPRALFEQAFADLPRPEETLAPEPASGTPDLAHRFYAVHEKDMPQASIDVLMARPWKERPQNKASVVADLPLEVAHAMLGLRLEQERKKPDAPFLAAGVFDLHDVLESWGVRVQEGEQLSITCKPEQWRAALAACEAEVRRAIAHGFEQRELDEVRADWLRALDEAVGREQTLDGYTWVEALLGTAESDAAVPNAATQRAIVGPALTALELAQCRAALAKAWSEGTLVIGVSGALDLGPDAAAILREAYETCRAVKVEPRASAELAPFAYASDAEKAGKVAAREHVEDLDLHVVRFENGVRAILKRTDFEQRQILVSVPFGRGALDLDPQQAVLGFVARRIFDACGLEAHSADDLRRLCSGLEVNASFHMAGDQFELNGATTRADLLRECELLRACLVDAGWREEGFRVFAQRLPLTYAALAHQTSGPISLDFMPEVFSGDASKGMPKQAVAEAVTLAQVRAWLEPLLESATLDVVLVGDLDLEESIQALARTLGALPPRKPAPPDAQPPREAKLVTGLRRRYEIDSQDGKALVFVVFPATDGRDVATRRRLDLLAEVLGDRLRVEVREKLSASYVPSAFAQASESVRGDGVLGVRVTADPEHAEALVEAVLAVAQKLAEAGPTKEEVERMREPAQNQLRDARRSNAYWWNLLARMHVRHDALDELRTDESWLAGASAEELAPLAKAYLARERANVAVVVPRRAPAAADTSDASAPKQQ